MYLYIYGSTGCVALKGDTKLELVLPKDQHTQSMNFEFWINSGAVKKN